MNIKSMGILALAALLVVGCGGGGGGGGGFTGGGPETATVVITEDNAEEIIREIAKSSEFAMLLLTDLVFPPDTFDASSAKSGDDASVRPVVKTLFHSAISKHSHAESAGRYDVQPTAYPCSNADGSASVYFDGESITVFSFNNCTDYDDGEAVFPGTTDGQIIVDVLSIGDIYNPLVDFVVEIVWIDFSVEDDGEVFMAHGDMTLDFLETNSSITFDFSANQFDFSENDDSGSLSDYNYEMYFTQEQFREDGYGGVESSKFEGLAFFNINPDFVAVDDDLHSSSGGMIIYGINDTKIRLTALDADVAQIELDLTGGDPDGGDDVYESAYEISWDELLQII